MKRLVAIFLAVAFFASTLPCVAAEPIPFKALSESSSALPTFAAMSASSDDQSFAAHSGKRHLSKAGKILTWIGVGMLASGGAEMAYGFIHKDDSCVSYDYNTTCVSTGDLYKYGGAADAATGAVLLLVGLTRHTTD
jgi:hypothetical protein